MRNATFDILCSLSVPEWLTRLHGNSLRAIPTRFLPESLSLIRPQHAASDNPNHPCHMQTTNIEAVTLHSAALPDLVCTAVVVCLPLHAERLSHAPVSSMLLRAQFTFAPPRWKLSPSCALDVNDRRDQVAPLSQCTTTWIPPGRLADATVQVTVR